MTALGVHGFMGMAGCAGGDTGTAGLLSGGVTAGMPGMGSTGSTTAAGCILMNESVGIIGSSRSVNLNNKCRLVYFYHQWY